MSIVVKSSIQFSILHSVCGMMLKSSFQVFSPFMIAQQREEEEKERIKREEEERKRLEGNISKN